MFKSFNSLNNPIGNIIPILQIKKLRCWNEVFCTRPLQFMARSEFRYGKLEPRAYILSHSDLSLGK